MRPGSSCPGAFRSVLPRRSEKVRFDEREDVEHYEDEEGSHVIGMRGRACVRFGACGMFQRFGAAGEFEEAQVPAMRIGTMQTEDALPFWVAEQDGLYGDAQVDIVTFQSAQGAFHRIRGR